MDARTQRRLKREALREVDYNKSQKQQDEKQQDEDFLVSIPISDIRKILQAKRDTQKATLRGMALGEINYHLWKIQKICEKHLK